MSDSASSALYRDALVWDNHICLPHSHDSQWMQALLRHADAGVSVAVVNLGDSEIPLETQISMGNFYRTFILRNPERLQLIETAADIAAARAAGRMGVAFNIEGLWAMDDRIERLQLYAELGVRWILMAYNRNNKVAGGCHDEDSGLTPLGYRVIEEMDRVGIIKCCTHTGYLSAMDVMRNTDKPVIFSHSNARALLDHPRNIPDELIRACAETGGVVCVNGVSWFLGCPDSSIEKYVDHVQYIGDLVGYEHVGIGLDYVYDQDGMWDLILSKPDIWPGYKRGDIQFFPPERIPAIADEMLRRGLPDSAIRGVLGENMMRVAEQVWPQPRS